MWNEIMMMIFIYNCETPFVLFFSFSKLSFRFDLICEENENITFS